MIRLIDSRPNFFWKMYFLEKLCRICVQTDVSLVDINTVDFDSVRLSEKLEVCAKMEISKDCISSDICEKCVNKLRVSYHFLDMCKKSTKIIQGYLEKLIGTENELKHYNDYSNFENSELNTVVEKLPNIKLEKLDIITEPDEDGKSETENHTLNVLHSSDHPIRPCRKKQRITKEQRCSLLKRLLNRPKKERDKHVSAYRDNTFNYDKGGLKNIIDFAKNYEFSFKLDKNSNIESTPLDKLTAFSTNYFRRDFTEFKNHILYIIENRDRFECGSIYSTDDEDLFSGSEMEDDNETREAQVGFEEVVVEPDIKIKNEIMDCEEEESQCPLDYLETSFEEEEVVKIKKEEQLSDSDNDQTCKSVNVSTFYHSSTPIKEENGFSDHHSNSLDPFGNIHSNYKNSLVINSSPAVKLLDKLVSTYPMSSRKVFKTSNVRCRTRDQPYINPQLKDQFLYRSFRCDRCNRYFKSQGYLKAHTSKVH